MVETNSRMLPLGTRAPDFSLPDVDGRTVSLSDFKDRRAVLVIFMCNHCPFVKHVLDTLLELAREYKSKGVGIAGINANDAEKYPDDSPEKMKQAAEEKDFPFSYLYDEDQSTAKAYHAACTPDFFVFDSDLRLVYRGQMDDSRPGSGTEATGEDLRKALDSVLAGKEVDAEQKPSMGCNIKWKENNKPDYASVNISHI
mgnify:CR=1 FL=1